jgi:subtilisin family serine protease
MANYEHLPLPEFQGELKRKKERRWVSVIPPENRDVIEFAKKNIKNAENIVNSFRKLKSKYKDYIDVSLICKIEINQSVDVNSFDRDFLASMGMEVLYVNENKKGYWIVFSSDEELKTFQEKLIKYAESCQSTSDRISYKFFHAIESIGDIPPEEKIGSLLKREPLTDETPTYLNLELWRMEDSTLRSFIDGLKKRYNNPELFKITDEFITNSFALLRIKTTKTILDEILQFKEVAWVDRPPYPLFNPCEYTTIDISDIKVNPPSEDAAGILIIDSGIVANHPILGWAVGDEKNYQNVEKEVQDTVGHGTAVAGLAAFGDIEKCLENREFNASNWIFSAKIMYKDVQMPKHASYDPEKLLEHQLYEIVKDFLDNPSYRIKVVNFSLGNLEEVWGLTSYRQFPLASLIDEIALAYPEIVFIVSAGNANPRDHFESLSDILENYPDYLVQNPYFKIINPATSALSLTVGSIAPKERLTKNTFVVKDLWFPVAQFNQPSPFSRTGYGINGMIKPEVIEYGGNLILRESYNRINENHLAQKIAVFSNTPFDEGKFIRFDFGTSFAAPKVANIAEKIANIYPEASANFIKNLILLSADYPDRSVLTEKFNEETIYQTMGYGLPSFEKAIYSSEKRVVLLNEGKIGLNKFKIFSLDIPEEFFETKGEKKITVVLTYNPLVNRKRGDSYLGNQLKFKVYHSVEPAELAKIFAEIDLEQADDEIEIGEIKKYEIEMEPKIRRRSVSCHQKAWREYKRRPKGFSSPLSIVLFNLNKWIKDENYLQDYCISLTLEHKEETELYNLVKNKLRQRIRI